LKNPIEQTEQATELLVRPYPASQIQDVVASTELNPVEEPDETYPTVDAQERQSVLVLLLELTAGNTWEEIMYLPAPQATHVLGEVPAALPARTYLPIAQLTQVLEEVAPVEEDHWPAKQNVHAVFPVEVVAVYVPAAQAWHAELLDWPTAAL